MLVEFCGLEFDLPDGWKDVTDEGDPPALARPDGVGIIQFSFFSVGDEQPRLTIGDLRTELKEFGEGRGFPFEQQIERSGEISCVGGTSLCESELFATWFLTEGSNLVCMTYVCLEPGNPQAHLELKDAENIISTMTF